MSFAWGYQQRKREAERQKAIEEAAEMYLVGKKEYGLGNIEKAYEIFTGAINRSPAVARYFFARARCHQKMKIFDRGIFDASMAIGLEGDMWAFWNCRGECQYALGELEDSMADFTEAIRLDTRHHIQFYNRGLIYYDLGEYDHAERDFRASLAINPGHSDSHLALARVLRSKDVHSAIHAMREAMQGRSDPDVMNELGEVLIDADQYAEAVKYFSMALELEKKARYYNNRGLARYLLDQFDEAMDDFSNALKLPASENVARADTLFHRANCYRILGRVDTSVKDAGLALRIVEAAPKYRVCHALALQAAGEAQEALDELRGVVASHNDVTYAWYFLGLGSLFAGRANDATVALKRCMDDEPGCPRVRELLGRAYHQLLEYGPAVDNFTEALRLEMAHDTPEAVKHLIISCRYDSTNLPPMSRICPAFHPWRRLAAHDVGPITDFDADVVDIPGVPPSLWHLFFNRGLVWLRGRKYQQAYFDLRVALILIVKHRDDTSSLEDVARWADAARHGKRPDYTVEKPESLSVYGVFPRTLPVDQTWLSFWNSDSRCADPFRRRIAVLADNDDLFAVYRSLAEVCEKTSRHEEASDYLQQGIEILQGFRNPDQKRKLLLSNTITAMAVNLFEIEQYGPAEGRIREALAASDPQPVQYYDLGRILIELGRAREACVAFRKALAARKTTPAELVGKAAYYLGIACAKCEAWDEAIEAFTLSSEATAGVHVSRFASIQYMEWPPQRVAIVHERAKAYQMKGSLEAAVDDFTTVITHQPTNARALYRRGFCYKEMAEYIGAARDFDRARDLNPDEPAFWTTIAPGAVECVELVPCGNEADYSGECLGDF
ncbi:TPR repeat [Carpediemonas membranifera]|uniref:TPR repeat n=1 Tax=Carpediemonas membranifera TaxID=201153 RepID=A0A8J6E415_9EUKA|nr:TPR repeat [Carpediemonas membranifera]|eukprot:KAG9393892.1 TPR repeat [Carpediemonas membranifera]